MSTTLSNTPRPRTGAARTELPAGATPLATDAAQATVAEEQLPPGQVRLGDGTLVELRRLSGLDSARIEQLMVEAGFRHLEGPGQATYMRCCALCAVKSKDGRMQAPPSTVADLEAALMGYFESDMARITATYMRMSAGETFRG